MTNAERSRVDKKTEGKKTKKVKVVIDNSVLKVIKYAWFPIAALVLVFIGVYLGVGYVTKDISVFSRDMWSNFWDLLKNF